MRIALVTGGAGGLGLATAQRFAREDMTVVVADIDEAKAKEAASTLEGSGHRGIALNVTDEALVKNVFLQIEDELGPISVLAHFAGTLGEGGIATGISLIDSSMADWMKVQEINSTGTYLCIREMARHRRARPVAHPRIIAVSSLAGQTGGLQSGAAYAASKAAVLGLMRTAARDLAPLGVTVNAIAPGPIDTPMLAQATGTGATGKYTKMDSVPLGRVGEPREIAAAAAFLASVDAGFITGATIDINGGLFMQ